MATNGETGPIVAVLPARGGSKRIPRKNIRPYRDIPLLARAIDTVLRSEVFDQVIISTDDDEIAAVGTAAGARVPFRRPDSLAGDHVGARPVIIHAIDALEDELGTALGPVCIVYPTAVFIEPSDLRQGLTQLTTAGVDFVFTAAAFDAPIQRALRRREDGTAVPMWPEHTQTRSQDLADAYHDAGQFYWGRRDAWLAGKPVFASKSLMHILPRWRVQDIDTEEDWQRAELIHRLLGER